MAEKRLGIVIADKNFKADRLPTFQRGEANEINENDAKCTARLYADRIDDRCRDHWYFGCGGNPSI